MSNKKAFIFALKQAAENYINSTPPGAFTILGFFGYRSAGTRMLINELANLKLENPGESLKSAVKAIVTYIHRVGTSDNLTRGFWVTSLQPCLLKFAKDPITDLSTEDQQGLVNFELAPFPCTPQIAKQRALLFNALGTEVTLALRPSLDSDHGVFQAKRSMDTAFSEYKDRKQDGSTPGAARILRSAFALNKNIPGKIYPFATTPEQQASLDNKYQGNTLLQMLDMIDQEELLIILKNVNPQHSSASFMEAEQSFVYKIADRPQENMNEAQRVKMTMASIDCLKELKRINLFFHLSKNTDQLYAVVVGDPTYFFKDNTKSAAEIAYAIADHPLWERELTNKDSKIFLEKILVTQKWDDILQVLEIKKKATHKLS
jgi:hypothetical protein